MNLDKFRDRIDRIDEKLVRLLNERVETAIKLGELKNKEGLPVHDPAREDEVLTRVKNLNKGPLDDKTIETTYRRIIAACLDLQNKREIRNLEYRRLKSE